MTGSKGKFVKQFIYAGTYQYSTGLIDSATIFASGTLRVVQEVDKPSRVSVVVNGVEAEHIGSSNNAQPVTAHCVFQGRDRVSPYATVDISLNAHGSDGFQASSCNNYAIIMFGNNICTVTGKARNFACEIDGTGVDISDSQTIKVIIPDMGATYYDNQQWTADDNDSGEYTYDKNQIWFGAFVTGVADGSS